MILDVSFFGLDCRVDRAAAAAEAATTRARIFRSAEGCVRTSRHVVVVAAAVAAAAADSRLLIALVSQR